MTKRIRGMLGLARELNLNSIASQSSSNCCTMAHIIFLMHYQDLLFGRSASPRYLPSRDRGLPGQDFLVSSLYDFSLSFSPLGTFFRYCHDTRSTSSAFRGLADLGPHSKSVETFVFIRSPLRAAIRSLGGELLLISIWLCS
jgi:hypothetical protein